LENLDFSCRIGAWLRWEWARPGRPDHPRSTRASARGGNPLLVSQLSVYAGIARRTITGFVTFGDVTFGRPKARWTLWVARQDV